MMALIVMAMMAGVTTKVMAQTQTSATLSTSTSVGVKLIVPMGVSETSALHFGTLILKDALAGTCTLPSNSTTRSFSSNIVASGIGTQAKNAAYDVTGTKNSTYLLTLPTSVIVTEPGANKTMTIDNFKASFTNGAVNATSSTLGSDGKDHFTVGGTLNIGADQAGGVYTGTFNVTVDYN